MLDQFIPVNGNVLIKPIFHENKSASGIIMASDNKEQPFYGEVVSVAHGAFRVNIKKGDFVFFKLPMVTPVKIDNQAFYLTKIDELLGIIES